MVQSLLGHSDGLWSPALPFSPRPESPAAFRATPQSAPSLAPAAHEAGVQEEEEGVRCRLLCGRPCSKPLTVTSSSLPHPSPEKQAAPVGHTWRFGS